jgi:hypothetical protein
VKSGRLFPKGGEGVTEIAKEVVLYRPVAEQDVKPL